MTSKMIINKDELKNLRFLLQNGQKLAISTKEFERVFDKIDSLEQENKELKEEKQTIKNYLGIESKTILERLEELDEWKHNDKLLLWKYHSALEEIKKECKCYSRSRYTQEYDRKYGGELHVNIIETINEVLNDK